MRVQKTLWGTKIRLKVKFCRYNIVNTWGATQPWCLHLPYSSHETSLGLVFSNFLCLPSNPSPRCQEAMWHLTLSCSVDISLLFLYIGVKNHLDTLYSQKTPSSFSRFWSIDSNSEDELLKPSWLPMTSWISRSLEIINQICRVVYLFIIECNV